MKIRALLVAMSVATVLTGCQNMDSSRLLSSGAEAFQAYSLSDAQVKKLSDQACQEMDSKATIAPANSEYARRLTTISRALGDNINGQPVNYKVYMAKDVNAFAMANGCIRVYSGLMDMMTDNEVEAVLGHEMGHVALGHVKKGMQVALGTNANSRCGGLCRRNCRQFVTITTGRPGRKASQFAIYPTSGIRGR